MAERGADNYTSFLLARRKSGGTYDTDPSTSDDVWQLISATGRSVLRSANITPTVRPVEVPNVGANRGIYSRVGRIAVDAELTLNWEASVVVPVREEFASDPDERWQLTWVNKMPTNSASEPALTEQVVCRLISIRDTVDGTTLDTPVVLQFQNVDGSTISTSKATS